MLILFIIIVAVSILAGTIARRPSDFRITRTGIIYAPVPSIFAQVNDLHNWGAWSPWARMDPDAETTFEGPFAGKGATMRWASSNHRVGEGTMTIAESTPYEFIKLRLEFFKPFKAVNTAEFTFRPNGNHTVVTWCTYGKNNFIAKAADFFLNCEKMVGDQFSAGLANLRSLTESMVKNS